MNCPINEQTADGYLVGRCWFHLKEGKFCPRHGDVSKAVEVFNEIGKLTLEEEHNPELKEAIKRNNSR